MPHIAPVDPSEYAQIGKAYGIERLDFPAYNSTEDGSVVLNFSDIGSPQGFVLGMTIAKYGRERPFSPMVLNMMTQGGIRAFPGEQITVDEGLEPDPRLQVIGVSSGQSDGNGLDSVELVIEGPHKIDVPWVNTGETIVGGANNDRSFVVIDRGTQGTKQTIKVQPKDGIYDLSVVSGASQEFPDKSWFSLFGRNYNSEAANIDGIQRQYNQGGQRDFSIIAKEHVEKLKGRDLSQHYMTPKQDQISEILPADMFGIDPDGPYGKIRLYVNQVQLYNTYLLMQNMYKALMFEEGDRRKIPGTYTGSGLKPQIDPNRFYSASSKDILAVLKRIIYDMTANNALASRRLTVYLGSEIYIAVTEALHAKNYLPARQDVNYSFADADRGLFAGQRMSGLFVPEFGGHELELIEDQSLNATNTGGRKSSISANVGGRSREAFIVDHGPNRNLDLTLNGEAISEDTPKVMLWAPAEPTETGEAAAAKEFQYVYREGIIDKFGRRIDGRVNNFGENIDAKYIGRMGVALLDQFAVSHLQMV